MQEFAKELKQYWVLLSKYLLNQKRQVILLSVALFGSVALEVLAPQILRLFIDGATSGATQQRLIALAVSFIAITLISQLSLVYATSLGEGIAWRSTNDLCIDVTEHCIKLDMSFHASHPPGELVERIDGDISKLANFFSQFSIKVAANFTLLIGILILLFVENWLVGVAMTVITVMAIFGINKVRTSSRLYWWRLRESYASFFGLLGEQSEAKEDLRVNGGIPFAMYRFYSHFRDWVRIRREAKLTSFALWAVMTGFFAIGNIVVLGLGAYLWNIGGVTIGTVYMLFYYADLLRKPIEELRPQLEDLQQASASIERVTQLLNVQPTAKPGLTHKLSDGPLSIRFNELSFEYVTGANTLKNVTFNLEAGEVLGVLGRTGSGKTTLMRLLAGFYGVGSGMIFIGDTDITHLSPHRLYSQIGIVTQDVQLLHTTIRNNLTFFSDSISDMQILQVLEELNLRSWLKELPHGLDTIVGSTIGNLSSGEAQLLALARIFLKDPGVVILDEAASRLDPATERLLDKAMSRLLLGRTGIIIAHRLSSVQMANKILVLDDGHLIEFGDRVHLSKDSNSRFNRLIHSSMREVLV